MDKINENYIQKQIQDSRKNWYMYFCADTEQEDFGMIEANDEKDAYVKFFNNFVHVYAQIFINENIKNKFFAKKYYKIYTSELDREICSILMRGKLIEHESFIDIKNRLSLLFLSENQEEQNVLDNLVYKFMKNVVNNGGYTIYNIKSHIKNCNK